MKLYQLPEDKVQHWFYGTSIACIFTFIAYLVLWSGGMWILPLIPFVGWLFASFVGLAKEIRDYTTKTGTVDFWDFATTSMAGLVVSLTLILPVLHATH